MSHCLESNSSHLLPHPLPSITSLLNACDVPLPQMSKILPVFDSAITVPPPSHPPCVTMDLQQLSPSFDDSTASGEPMCGVLNQHGKPCQRLGRCPFHSGNSSGNSSGNTVSSGLKRDRVKKGWTRDEHRVFLEGLLQYGRGNWKQISILIATKSAAQVQSHAQKYFLRQKQTIKNKRSIHDYSLSDFEAEMQNPAKRQRVDDVEEPIGSDREELGAHLPPPSDDEAMPSNVNAADRSAASIDTDGSNPRSGVYSLRRVRSDVSNMDEIRANSPPNNNIQPSVVPTTIGAAFPASNVNNVVPAQTVLPISPSKYQNVFMHKVHQPQNQHHNGASTLLPLPLPLPLPLLYRPLVPLPVLHSQSQITNAAVFQSLSPPTKHQRDPLSILSAVCTTELDDERATSAITSLRQIRSPTSMQ